MGRLGEVVGGIGSTNIAPVTPYEAVIATTATTYPQDVFVTIPSIDQGRTLKGAVRWTPISGPNGPILPTKGDIAQVVRTQEGYYWVTQFIPSVYPVDLLIEPRVTALEAAQFPLSYQKRQNSSIAQAGPGNGILWVYNITNAPYIDVTPGTWYLSCEALVISNVADFVGLGFWNETAGAGISGSAMSASVVQAGGVQNKVNTEHILVVASNARIRIWVIPNGASNQTVVASSALSTAAMIGYRIR